MESFTLVLLGNLLFGLLDRTRSACGGYSDDSDEQSLSVGRPREGSRPPITQRTLVPVPSNPRLARRRHPPGTPLARSHRSTGRRLRGRLRVVARVPTTPAAHGLD